VKVGYLRDDHFVWRAPEPVSYLMDLGLDGDRFDLDQQPGKGERLYHHCGARGRIIAKDFGAADARMEDIVKINTFITDSSKFMDMLAARSEIFGNDPPASTAVLVQALAFTGLLIEVEAIAIKP
jgi:hypothetical protein